MLALAPRLPNSAASSERVSRESEKLRSLERVALAHHELRGLTNRGGDAVEAAEPAALVPAVTRTLEAAMRRDDWAVQLGACRQLLYLYSFYMRVTYPQFGLRHLQGAFAALKLSDLRTAAEMASKASRILAVTHGAQHVLAQRASELASLSRACQQATTQQQATPQQQPTMQPQRTTRQQPTNQQRTRGQQQAAGKQPASQQAAGEQVASQQAAGEEVASQQAAGEEAEGQQAAGEQVAAGQAAGADRARRAASTLPQTPAAPITSAAGPLPRMRVLLHQLQWPAQGLLLLLLLRLPQQRPQPSPRRRSGRLRRYAHGRSPPRS